AVGDEDWRRARHFIARLGRRERQHAIVVKWQNDLAARADRLIASSQAAAVGGRHDEAYAIAREATRVWPTGSNVRPGFERAARRFQQLQVGVTRLAGDPTVFPLATAAEERERRLVTTDLFEIDRLGESPHYRTRFFEQWEPADLGREAVFTLRQSRSYWESQPVVTAQSVVATLARRLDPGDPAYDERLDSYIRSLTIRSPFQVHVAFDRVPLRTEMMFTFPAEEFPEPVRDEEPAGASDSGPPEPAVPASAPLLTRRFVRHDRTDDVAVYRRAFPEPDGVAEFHAAEVVERKYDTHDRAVQGLLRGEVSVLPHVESRDVARLREDGRFFVQEYALPYVHLVQFNPRSRALRQREFRRALAYGLDRRKILNDLVLGGAAGQGRIVTAAWSTRSYAYNTIVRPRECDPTQALALSLAAKTALKAELPELKLVCDPDATMRRAAAEMIRQWDIAGLKVALVPDDGPPVDLQSAEWDILYRRLKMVEPVTELWPLLVLEDRARVESLASVPDWLRQKLIALDDETNWNAAVRQLHDLQQDLWGEALWIPLFEVDDFMVVRKNIRGLAAAPMHAYHKLEEWIVDPWYPTETP
ncbi:MAG TPA: ABC transporter substrate-binding protein, partial [Planctomycetaceae bacterium]|nr:ABC transporter substrate-binding protein [Planctomycetaceae bacterium]